MRNWALAACLGVFAAVTLMGDFASAAECSRGMLWPYVRNAGDCLTDEEVSKGQTGVYAGALNTNPDVASVRLTAPPPTISDHDADGALTTPAGMMRTGLRQQLSTACNKGALWPFVRDPGDCLSDVEKKDGHKGVFGDPDGKTPIATAAVLKPAGHPDDKDSVLITAPNCTKGALWPFVREAGDCATDIEKEDAKKAGRTVPE